MSEEKFVTRMMYKTELARAYGVSIKTINNMLKATREHYSKDGTDVFGEYKGRRLLTIRQVTICIEHNGKPYE